MLPGRYTWYCHLDLSPSLCKKQSGRDTIEQPPESRLKALGTRNGRDAALCYVVYYGRIGEIAAGCREAAQLPILTEVQDLLQQLENTAAHSVSKKGQHTENSCVAT